MAGIGVHEWRPSEFVIQIMGAREGLYALTSYGKIWLLVEATGYAPEEWHPVALPPLDSGG